jgi:hypothetical protein
MSEALLMQFASQSSILSVLVRRTSGKTVCSAMEAAGSLCNLSSRCDRQGAQLLLTATCTLRIRSSFASSD